MDDVTVTSSIADSAECTEEGHTHDFDDGLMGDEIQAPEDYIDLQPDSRSFSEHFECKEQLNINFDDLGLSQQLPDASAPHYYGETLEDLYKDNIYFREKYSRSEEMLQRFLQEERCELSSSIGLGKADSARMARTIEEKDKRIAELERKVTHQKFLRPFLELAREHHAPLDLKAIQLNFFKIRSQTKKLFRSKDFHHPGHRLGSGKLTDLDVLLRKSLGYSEHACARDLMHEEVKSKFPVNTVVGSLIGAAICEWVFEAELRALAMTTCPLLEIYRDHLKSTCKCSKSFTCTSS